MPGRQILEAAQDCTYMNILYETLVSQRRPTFLRRNVRRALQLHQEELDGGRSGPGGEHQQRIGWSMPTPEQLRDGDRSFQLDIGLVRPINSLGTSAPTTGTSNSKKARLFYIRPITTVTVWEPKIGFILKHSVDRNATLEGTETFGDKQALLTTLPFELNGDDFITPGEEAAEQYQLMLELSFRSTIDASEVLSQLGLPTENTSGRWVTTYKNVLQIPEGNIYLPLFSVCNNGNRKALDLAVCVHMHYNHQTPSILEKANIERRPQHQTTLRAPESGPSQSGNTKIIFLCHHGAHRSNHMICHFCKTPFSDIASLHLHLKLSHSLVEYCLSNERKAVGMNWFRIDCDHAPQECMRPKEQPPGEIPFIAPRAPLNIRKDLNEENQEGLREPQQELPRNSEPSGQRETVVTQGNEVEGSTKVVGRDAPAMGEEVRAPKKPLRQPNTTKDVDTTQPVKGLFEPMSQSSPREESVTEKQSPEARMKRMIRKRCIDPTPKQPIPEAPIPAEQSNRSKSPRAVISPSAPGVIERGRDRKRPKLAEQPTALSQPTSPSRRRAGEELDSPDRPRILRRTATAPALALARPTSPDATAARQQGQQPPTVLTRSTESYRVPKAPEGVTFYRQLTKRPLIEGEIVSDSDDDIDMEWLRLRTEQMLKDDAALPPQRKKFILLYNLHMREERLQGDCYVQESIVRFAMKNRDAVLKDGLIAEFQEKAAELVEDGFITPKVLEQIFGEILAEPVRAEEEEDDMAEPEEGVLPYDECLCGEEAGVHSEKQIIHCGNPVRTHPTSSSMRYELLTVLGLHSKYFPYCLHYGALEA
jgi:hypothetical protein